MIRSAAKNMKFVTVITDPSDYGVVLDEMRSNDGSTSESTRFRLGKRYMRVLRNIMLRLLLI